MLKIVLLVALGISIESASLAAPKDEALRENFVVRSEGADLAATLYRPRGSETSQLPAVVVAHGSDPSTRDMVGGYINLGLRMGLAVLAYDKRGTGQSTGKYEGFSVKASTAIFETQAKDLQAAFRQLVTRPNIDTARVGLLGGSQAGWIMPLTASRDERVKFVVACAGVPLSAGQADAQQTYLNWVANPADERFPLRHLFAGDMAAIEYHGPSGFDPEPILRKLKTPTLWIFGIYDYYIPTRPSIEKIGEFQKAKLTNHDIAVLPFADHSFRNAFTEERYDLTEVIVPWLTKQKVLPAR